MMILKFCRRENKQEISLENCEVEHDFSGGLSKSVTLKLSWQPSNLTKLLNTYDFAVARSYAKLAMSAKLNYNIYEFERY